jgi:hypothetical protein
MGEIVFWLVIVVWFLTFFLGFALGKLENQKP